LQKCEVHLIRYTLFFDITAENIEPGIQQKYPNETIS
jgi:hypothetical protein